MQELGAARAFQSTYPVEPYFITTPELDERVGLLAPTAIDKAE
jgi:hypothetical protein